MKLWFEGNWYEWPPEGGRFFCEDVAFAVEVQQFLSDWFAGKPSFQVGTSGSTGIPKRISLKREDMEASAKATIHAFYLDQLPIVWLPISPVHIGGMMVLVRAILAGQLVLLTQPVNHLSHDIHSDLPQADFTSLVPSQLFHLLSDSKSVAYLNRMKVILLGGGPVQMDLQQQISTKLQVPVYQTFGMTETISHFAYRQLNQPNAIYSPYQCLPGYEVEISEEQTMKVKGVVTHGSWLKTNDVVEILSATTFIWQGRKDNVVLTGGKKIQLETLEQKLENQFHAVNFFFAGLPHAVWGQALILLVESNPDKRLEQELMQVFSGAEKPKQVIFVPKFEYTPTGKINRNSTLQTAGLL